MDDPKKIKTFIDLLSAVSQDLTEEILNQKSLLAAENGELCVKQAWNSTSKKPWSIS